MTDAAPLEAILDLSTEGEGATVYRIPQPGGSWRFTFEVSSIFSDMDDDFAPNRPPAVPRSFATFQEALDAVLGPDKWLWIHPTPVHPDYCEMLLAMIEDASPRMRDTLGRHAEQHFERWRRACRR